MAAKEKPQKVTPDPATPAEQTKTSDLVFSPIRDSISFLRLNFKEYYLDLLKIVVSKIAVSLCLLLVFGLIFLIGYFSISMLHLNPGLPIEIGLLAIFLFIFWLIALVIQETFGLATMLLTEAKLSGQKFNLKETVFSLYKTAFKFLVVDSVVRLILAIPVILVIGFMIASPMTLAGTHDFSSIMSFMAVFLVAYIFVFLYLLVVQILYYFFLQFWQYGFLFEKMGIIAAMKRSVALAKSKPFDVLIFDVIFIILSALASLPLMAFVMIVYVCMIFLEVLTIFFPPLGLVVLAVAFIIIIIGAVLLSTITMMVSLPTHMLFWKKLKGN